MPAIPSLQIEPDSLSNPDNIDFDASVHHPFDEEQEEPEEGGTSVAVAEPGYNERGSVSTVTSARKSKYKKTVLSVLPPDMQANSRSIKFLRERSTCREDGCEIPH